MKILKMSINHRLNLYLSIIKLSDFNSLAYKELAANVIFNPLLEIDVLINVLILTKYLRVEDKFEKIVEFFLFFERKLIEKRYKSPFIINNLKKSLLLMNDVVISGFYKITKDFIPAEVKIQFSQLLKLEEILSLEKINIDLFIEFDENDENDEIIKITKYIHNFCKVKEIPITLSCFIFLDFMKNVLFNEDKEDNEDNEKLIQKEYDIYGRFLNAVFFSPYWLSKDFEFIQESIYRKKITQEFITVDEYDYCMKMDKIYSLYMVIIF